MAFQGELLSGDALFPPSPQQDQNSSVVSLNDSYHLIMQEDGNLVLYQLTGSRGQVRTHIWASHTNGHAVSRCIMQTDGNLVIYNTENKHIWASGTPGHKGSHLEVQDDGIAVIYTPDHTIIWSRP
jgi:hypothetical protein